MTATDPPIRLDHRLIHATVPTVEPKQGYGSCEACHSLKWIKHPRHFDPVTKLLYGVCSRCAGV